MASSSKILGLITKSFLRYPWAFIKNINYDNFIRLKHALKHESFKTVTQNIFRYFERSKEHSEVDIKKNILAFCNKLELPDDKEPILFVSHETTRTGAPLIILKLAHQFKESGKYFPIFICLKGGEIKNEFDSHFPCYFIQNQYIAKLRLKEMKFLVESIGEIDGPKKAIVNSVESMDIVKPLNKSGFYTLSLIHELADYYLKGEWTEILKYSNKVVFPANFVANQAKKAYPENKTESIILGQGLLKPELLSLDKAFLKKQLRTELKIPSDAKIVIGCGSTIARKGIDIFVTTAISVLNLQEKKGGLYFIWLGDAPANQHQVWSKRDVEQSGLKNKIRFLGSKSDISNYFLGSDLFFMTSRGDPYPCVVHEALASGLPVVAFNNAGGFNELITKEIGQIVPYGDIFAAVKIINNLITDDDLLSTKSSNSRDFAEEKLDFTIYTKEIQKLIK